MKEEVIKKLSEEHWKWVEGLLKTMDEDFTLEIIGYLYKTAFIHGAKHFKELIEKED